MTPRPTRAMLCDRTREWVSLRLDGELSDFEAALMDGHLERCEECRAFAHDIDGITGALREAAFEPLTAPLHVTAPRRLLPTRHVQAVAAAALIVVAVGLGSLYGAVRGSSAVSETAGQIVHAPMVGYADESTLLRELRLAELKPHGPIPIGAAKPVLRISV